jgi:hypothetical protein
LYGTPGIWETVFTANIKNLKFQACEKEEGHRNSVKLVHRTLLGFSDRLVFVTVLPDCCVRGKGN